MMIHRTATILILFTFIPMIHCQWWNPLYQYKKVRESIWTVRKIYDHEYHKFVARRMLSMTQMIYMDVLVKMEHMEKYIEMQRGTVDYELGLVTGLILREFRQMLHSYKSLSNPFDLSRNHIADVNYFFGGYYKFSSLSDCVSGYEASLAYRDKFFAVLEEFKIKTKKILAKKRQCKKDGSCRRSFNTDSARDENLGPNDFETDFFGHQVPKGKKKYESADMIAELLKISENPDIPFDKLPKVQLKPQKFKKINDWLRYLANGGLKRNIMFPRGNETEDDLMELVRVAKEEAAENQQRLNRIPVRIDSTRFAKTPDNPDLETFNMFASEKNGEFDVPDYETFKKLSSGKGGGFDEALKKIPTAKIPNDITKKFAFKKLPSFEEILKGYPEKSIKPNPWSKQDSDHEFKKQLRQKYFDNIRGNFDPKREGIDIDLEGLF